MSIKGYCDIIGQLFRAFFSDTEKQPDVTEEERPQITIDREWAASC